MKKSGPDSLNSWIIAAGCCFINMMMFGMSRLSGVLFVASVPRFHVSRESASFPYTFSACIRNTSGPLVGFLGQKFGVRAVTFFGCLLAAIGIGTCFLAENIATITGLWGVLFGLGFGLGNILLPISINQYFDKKRATASGISFSGACLGSFVLPPIVEILINSYGLSGTFLILSGFVLNCLPVALLLRKPNFVFKPKKQNVNNIDEKQSITQGKNVRLYTVDDPSLTMHNSQNKSTFQYTSTTSEYCKKPMSIENTTESNRIREYNESVQRLSSQTLLTNYSDSKNALDYETVVRKSDAQKGFDQETPECRIDSIKPSEICNEPEKTEKFICSIPNSSQNSEPYTFSRTLSMEYNLSLRKTVIDKQYSKSYDELYSNHSYQGDLDERLKEYPKKLYGGSQSFTPSDSVFSDKEGNTSILASFSVISDPVFILIALTNAIYNTIFVCMITVIVDFARDIHVGEMNEKYVIMSLSVGDLIGRLGLGWVTDEGYMTRSHFAALCFICQAVTTTVTAWSTGFTMLITMAALYGLSEAGLILIFPLLIAEFIQEEKQTVAIPSSYFLTGPLCLAVAPLIGFFRDEIGSYEIFFYGMGAISFVCALCWLLAPCIERCRRTT